MLLIAACSDSHPLPGEEATPSTTGGDGTAVTDHDPRVARISQVVGCDSVRGTSTGFEFDPGSASFVCAVDGEDLALIHLFDHRDRAGMVSGFELRIDRAALNPCPDGTRPPGPWIVVGYDWAASSFQRELMSALSSSLDAEFIGGGSAQDDPPVGPPASYLVPGYCIVGR